MKREVEKNEKENNRNNVRISFFNEWCLSLALAIHDENKLKESLKDCYHLKLLQKRGFQADIDYCLSTDIIDIVPKLVNGKFIL